ncbi:MAG: hypothetical protein IT388_00685 [Nitrospirales bacterium]|nr:hypothetical protein [Nitrospirales bacterium]
MTEREQRDTAAFLRGFDDCGRQPYRWLQKAESLRRTAEIIAGHVIDDFKKSRSGEKEDGRKPEIYPVYLMIAGLALEVLLKGILVGRGEKIVDKGEFKGWSGGSHDLLRLIERVSIRIDEKERWFFERLSEHISWAGKYPIPKRYKKVMPRPMPQGFACVTYFSSEDISLFKSSYEMLKVMVQAEIEKKRAVNRLAES